MSAEVHPGSHLSGGDPLPTLLPNNVSENTVQERSPLGEVQNTFLNRSSGVKIAIALRLSSALIIPKDNRYIYSKRIANTGETDCVRKVAHPCVVFFPGDISDFQTNSPGMRPNWTLENMHHRLANLFPSHDVLTIVGELLPASRMEQRERTFDEFPGPEAIARVEHYLQVARPDDGLDGDIVLAGFSRGGLVLSRMINHAASKPAFWHRVESIHYIDVGGPEGFDVNGQALTVLHHYSSKIWFNFQKTRVFDLRRGREHRDCIVARQKMIGWTKHIFGEMQVRDEYREVAGLPSGNFEQHMLALHICSVKRPGQHNS